jgi:hypothetical protein
MRSVESGHGGEERNTTDLRDITSHILFCFGKEKFQVPQIGHDHFTNSFHFSTCLQHINTIESVVLCYTCVNTGLSGGGGGGF